MKRALGLLVVLLAAPLCVAEDDLDEERAMAKTLNERYSVEFRERVNDSIERGVKHLLATQALDGSWPSPHNAKYPMGPTVLAVLTLQKAGLERDHTQLQRAWEYVYAQELTKTYSVAILLMALDAKYAPARDPFEVEDVDRYGSEQKAEAGDPCALTISKQDKALMARGVKFLLDKQTAEGTWRYPSGGFDLSNTQYALLGLKAAIRCGIKVPERVWLDALRFLLEWQVADGASVDLEMNEIRGEYRIAWMEKAKARGFRYAKPKQPVTGSMTTAGLAGLVVCQAALWESRRFKGKLRQATRIGIRDAMAWMQVHFDVTWNPREGASRPDPMTMVSPHHYYYLYGLERAGIFARVRYFGEHDWYEEGAELLIHDQRDDGGWATDPGRHKHTCFAILFLKRATARMRVPAITPSRPDAGR